MDATTERRVWESGTRMGSEGQKKYDFYRDILADSGHNSMQRQSWDMSERCVTKCDARVIK